MRVFGVGLIAVLGVAAAFLWLRALPGGQRPPRAANAHAIATASNDGVSEHTLDAGDAVRHARTSSSGLSAKSASDSAALSSPPSSSSGPSASKMPRYRRDTPEPDVDAPKPAGELFVPFIANDPSQVFAAATVNFHAAVQAEAIDPEWGPFATQALRGYIETMFGARFEIPYVDCRQDLCELQIAGRVGNDLRSDTRDIQNAMTQMKQQPWWTMLQFDQESGTVGSSQDGRLILLWFFSRK